MRRTKRNVIGLLAATGALGAIGIGLIPGAVGAAAAKPGPTEEHCVVQVTSRDPDGQMHLSEPVCAPTRTAAVAAAGLEAKAAAADWAIGIHYEGAGYTGSSLMVVGADCTGGWLNTPAGWSNRISSTMNGCPRIRHFDGYFLVTPEQTTLSPGGNLVLLDNRTSSIQYLP